MSNSFACPGCDTVLRIAGPIVAGRKVRCPKCSLVSDSDIQTCGNCGMYLRVAPRTLVTATDVPPPGGAAVA